MRYTLTLELDIAESRRSSSDTTRRARDAAAKITEYAGRLKFVTGAELAMPGGLVRVFMFPELDQPTLEEAPTDA